MNTVLLRRIGLAFLGNLAWVAGLMYAATKRDPWSEYLDLALYFVVPVLVYLLVLYRSGWMPRVHAAIRLLLLGFIGFVLTISAAVATGFAYSLALSHTLKTL